MDANLTQRAATEAIIQSFGGMSKMAKELGHNNCTTVQGWKKRGVIPARQHAKVLEAAERLKLSRPDFVNPPSGYQAAA